MAFRKAKGAKSKRGQGNGMPVEYRALGEAYHDACYTVFLKQIEDVLDRDPQARARMDKLIREFREAVLGKMKF